MEKNRTHNLSHQVQKAMINKLWPFLLSIVGWINLSWAYTFHVACSAERLLVRFKKGKYF